VSTSKPNVNGRLVSFEKYSMVTGWESSWSVKSFFARLDKILPCLSRTVTNTFTTFTFTETVGVLLSSMRVFPATVLLGNGEGEVSCANEVPTTEKAKRAGVVARERSRKRENALGRCIANTMRQFLRTQSKSL
jgi:hypothetical protein